MTLGTMMLVDHKYVSHCLSLKQNISYIDDLWWHANITLKL